MVNKILTLILILLIVWLQYQIWYVKKGQSESVLQDYKQYGYDSFGYTGVRFEQKSIALLQLEIAEQVKQNKQLTSQNKQLKKEVWMLRNKPEILEEKAREQLGLIKKDEVFYRIIPKEQ